MSNLKSKIIFVLYLFVRYMKNSFKLDQNDGLRLNNRFSAFPRYENPSHAYNIIFHRDDFELIYEIESS